MLARNRRETLLLDQQAFSPVEEENLSISWTPGVFGIELVSEASDRIPIHAYDPPPKPVA